MRLFLVNSYSKKQLHFFKKNLQPPSHYYLLLCPHNIFLCFVSKIDVQKITIIPELCLFPITKVSQLQSSLIIDRYLPENSTSIFLCNKVNSSEQQ